MGAPADHRPFPAGLGPAAVPSVAWPYAAWPASPVPAVLLISRHWQCQDEQTASPCLSVPSADLARPESGASCL